MKVLGSVLVGIMLSFISCELLTNDDVISLGGGYFYRNEGIDHTYIYYHQSSERKNIYPKVTQYAFDSSFILVVQNPVRKFVRAHLASSLNNGQADFNILLSKADSIIAHDPLYVRMFASSKNYWIIDKSTNQLYGPLSEADFEKEKKRLKIPDSLSVK